MSSTRDQVLESILEEKGVRLSLQWCGDRFEQQLAVITDEGAVSLAHFVTNAETPGPVFQELSIEPISGRDTAFLVGMSGRDYWSASIEVLSGQRGFLFDLSLKSEAQSSLRLAANFEGKCVRQTCDSMEIQVEDRWRCLVDLVRLSGMSSTLVVSEQTLHIDCVRSAPNLRMPLRCKFQLRIEPLELETGTDRQQVDCNSL